jgi:NADH dehydrogenase
MEKRVNNQVRKIAKSKHKVVIVGGNFAGISAARQLSSLNSGDLEIYLIDQTDNFNWTPNVHEILSGVKRQQGVEISRHDLVSGLDLTFVQDKVVELDTSNKRLRLQSGAGMEFDACLVACGYQANSVNGSKADFNFRSADEVQQITQAIEDLRAQKDQLDICIIGGGFSGVEALGELLRRYRWYDGVRISLIESAERLVKNLPEAISEDILRLTATFPVQFRFGWRVAGVEADRLTLADGSVYQSDIRIWTTGCTLPSFVKKAGLTEAGENAIAVTGSLQSVVTPACFVAGDAADVRSEDLQPLPKQSYHAIDLGHAAATNLVKWLRGEAMQEFEPRLKPTLLSLGDLNTYMISGDSVVASPLLAAFKEAIYQVNMLKLTSPLPFVTRKYGLVSRLIRSTGRLLLPELWPTTPLKIISRSRILKYGSAADLVPLVQGARSTLFDSI